MARAAWTIGMILAGSTSLAPQAVTAAPAVVVAVVVDQLAAWQADQRLALLPADGGFARLRREGTWFQDVRYPYATTETACGHPALFSGAPPRQTRVASNDVPLLCSEAGAGSVSSSGPGSGPGSGSGCERRISGSCATSRRQLRAGRSVSGSGSGCIPGQPVRDAAGTTRMTSQVHIATARPERDGGRLVLDLRPLSGPGGAPNPDAPLVGDALPAHWQRVALSCKDRGAGFAVGHRADAMVWWNAKKQRFVAPDGAVPAWAAPWAEPLAGEAPLVWAALDPAFLARHAGLDAAPGEGGQAHAGHQHGDEPPGALLPAYGATLPKDIQRNRTASHDLRGYAFRTSPFCDASALAMAQQALRHYRPAASSPPLYLALSLSANDYIGHAFGSHSHESWDNLLRLDAGLAALFAELDKHAGPDGWALVLSADHGVLPLPETPDAQRGLVLGPGGRSLWQLPRAVKQPGRLRLVQGAVQRVAEAAANKALAKWFRRHKRQDPQPLIVGVGAPFVFLGPALRGEGPDALPPSVADQAIAAVRKAVLQLPGALALYDTAHPAEYGQQGGLCPPLAEPPLDAAPIAQASDPLLQALVCKSIPPELEQPAGRRLYLVTHAGWFFETDDTPGAGANHGSPHLYDRSVPLLVRGPGAAAGAVERAPQSTDRFAATLRQWLAPQ